MTGEPPDFAEAFANLSRSVTRLAESTSAYTRARLGQAADTMQSESRRRMWLVLSAAAMLLWLTIGVVFAGVAIIAAFWDTHRVIASCSVAAGFFVLAGVAAWVLRRKWRQRPTVFDWAAGIMSAFLALRRQARWK